MLRLALGQLRIRPVSFLGLAVALLLAVAGLTTFALLLVAGASGPAPTGDQPGLAVIGGAFGEVVVLVSLLVVVNTLGFAIRQQQRDLALLRTIAATPKQVRRLVRWQVVAVTLLCSPPAWLLGELAAHRLLDAVVARDLAPAGDRIPDSPLPLAVATLLTGLIGVVAAAVATRRISRIPPAVALGTTGANRLGPVRVLAGLVALGGGVALCLVVASTTPEKAATGALLAALVLMVAVALLGPLPARLVVTVAGAPLQRLLPEAGWLAQANLRGYALRLSSAVVPLALLSGLACTFMFVTDTIADAAHHTAVGDLGNVTSATDRWLRSVELGVLVIFGGLATVNTVAALTAARRREFGLLSLIGASRRQLRVMLVVETALTAGVGVLLGTLIAGGTALAFSHTLPGAPLPSVSLGGYLQVVVMAVALSAIGSVAAGWRALSGPPTEMVASSDS